MLKRTESFGDYFQARRALQRYVYPYGTSHKVLIKDIMEGIPAHLHPIIRANSTEVRNIEDFRRVLIDLEPGIRDVKGFAPHASRTTTHTKTSQVNNVNTANTGSKGEKTRFESRKDKKGVPKTPCRCGEMHWCSDCPQKRKTAEVNQAQKAPRLSSPNNIPLGKDVKKAWKEKKPEASVKEVNTVQLRPRQTPAKTNKDGKHDSATQKSNAPADTSEQKKADISPTYALARFDSDTGTLHPICIDTGASISCIDYDYAKKHLSDAKITPTSNVRLMGVGTNMTSGIVNTTLHFVTRTPENHYKMQVQLYVVPRLNTKILLGNDHLVPLNPIINFEENQVTFANDTSQVLISNRRKLIQPPERRTARTKQVFTLQPGHQGKIPVVLHPRAEEGLYCIEASQPLNDIYVGRSVGSASNDHHYAMVSNFGKGAIKIPTGTLLSEYAPIEDSLYRTETVNNAALADAADPAFEGDVKNLDINPDLSPMQQEGLRNVIRRQHAAFAYGDRKLGRTDLAIMKIETGDALPISQAPYHASPAGRRIIDETLAELIAEDVIEESDSPWASPAILVHQKGKDRFCIDFRKVNEVTKADQYPIPRIDDILSQFSGKTYFTTFDANKGFHQIEIDPKDREKTAFRTHRGLHQYKRMPFGLKSGPGIFQRLMDKILGRYKWQIALVYIDDIIIYSKSFDDHLRDVETILSLVGKSGITLSPKKCHLGYQSLTALGHTISNLGIGTADGTVRAVTEFPKPSNKKELQRFLGLCVYYRRFVKDFSKIALPLYHLTKEDAKYIWDDPCETAFRTLKEKLTTAPTLAHPDYERPFLLYTDASNTGLGAVLAQNDLQGKEHPIVYLSRTLTAPEANYTITELECLAIVWSVRKLHAYLDGVKFTLITDHSALQWLFDFKGSNRRLVRWSMELQPYRDWMTIKYREGRIHLNADPLSRAPIAECNTVTVVDIPRDFIEAIVEGYQKDPYFNKVMEALDSPVHPREYNRFGLSVDLLITYSDPADDHLRICVPIDTADSKLRLNLLHDFHDSPMSGHLGMSRTHNLLSAQFYWPGLSRDVKDYVRSCSVCQRNKTSPKTYGPHQPLDVPPQRWHTLTMDFAGPFVVSGEGKWDMVMLVIDKVTKRCHLVPAKSTDTAANTARRFFDSIVRLHGLPSVIVSDRDTKFTSHFWRTLFERYGTKLALSTSYHPQTDGQSERMVRTVKEMLRSVVNHKQDNWADQLSSIEYAYNNSVHPSTNMTPFELDLGYHPKGMHSFLPDTMVKVQSTTDFIESMKSTQTAAQEHLEKARMLQAAQTNKGRPKPTSYGKGDLVMLSTKYINPPFLRGGGSRKLKAKYVGPFRVLRPVGPTSYELDLPTNVHAHPVVNLEYLKSYHPNPARFAAREARPPPPIEAGEGEELEFEVDHIKDHRTSKKHGMQYLVSWLNYPPEEDSWEPAEYLKGAQEAIDQYWKSESARKAANPARTTRVRNTRSS
jgi:transposase InsO family protein